MRSAAVTHVSPMVLWECLCGGIDLTTADHEHVILCEKCEALADEIAGALDDIEKSLGRRHQTTTS